MERRDFLKAIGAVPASVIVVSEVRLSPVPKVGLVSFVVQEPLALSADTLEVALVDVEGQELRVGRVKTSRDPQSWRVDGETATVTNVEPLLFAPLPYRSTVAGVRLYSGNGFMLFEGKLDAPVVVPEDASFSLKAGGLSLTL